MNKPFVSVIIPTYNCADYLERAMYSVCEYYSWPIEIIVIDDGSEDNYQTDQIMCGWPDVRYIKQEHKGPATARNAGIRASTGEYIAFLDADDEWLPGRLERTIAPMIQNPEIDLCYCNAITVSVDGKESPRGMDCEKYRIKNAIYPPPRICTPAVTIRKSVLDKVGMFPESLQIKEDQCLWMKIAYCSKVYEVKEPLVRVYEREDSLRHKAFSIGEKISAISLSKRYLLRFYLGLSWNMQSTTTATRASIWLSCAIQCIQDGYRMKAIKYLVKSWMEKPNRYALWFLLRVVIPSRLVKWIKTIVRKDKR